MSGLDSATQESKALNQKSPSFGIGTRSMQKGKIKEGRQTQGYSISKDRSYLVR
jgi:hypothetical protein